MKKLLPLLLIFIISCNPKINMDQEREKLLQTDIDFSNRSIEVGNQQAFLEYAAPEAVLLRPNSFPVVGREALRQLFSESSDSSYRLTWKPSYGKIAKSGDLGYTFGTYLLEITEGDKKGQVSRGTYCSIWEKNAKGAWRFVLDTGNSGLEEPKTDN